MELHEHMAQVYEDNLEPIKAMPHWRTIIRLDRKREEIRDKLISMYYLTNQDKQLIELYIEELKYRQQDKDLYYDLGNLHSSRGEVRKAEGIFWKLFKIFPDELNAGLRLIDIYEYRRNSSMAFKIYDDLIEKKLANQDLILRYVGYLVQDKKIFKASQILEQAIVDFSKNLVLQETLADTYVQLGARQKALKLYEQLYRENPQDNKTALNLADIYAGLRNYKKAVEFLENYHENQQGDYRSHHLLGDMYAALGDTNVSQREYEAALTLLRASAGK